MERPTPSIYFWRGLLLALPLSAVMWSILLAAARWLVRLLGMAIY